MFYITEIQGNKRKVISSHNTKDEALKAGEIAWKNSGKGSVISCLSGNVDKDGNITGKFVLYETWY